jgi:ribosome-dependent ATPase
MGRGQLTIAREIPSGFGRDLRAGREPEIAMWVDGSMPFRADTARGYALGVLTAFRTQVVGELGQTSAASALAIETRFLFNQAFKSANAIVPSVVMLILMLIPAIMAAIGVVREKETGTIANFLSTPITRVEFLLGKQLPYIVIAFGSFWSLYVLGRVLFGVPFTGNLALLALASLLYVVATTGLGQFVSTFTQTQVAAVFATAIITIIPGVNFSGLIVPFSSLKPMGQITGSVFPGAWYQEISAGSFVKGFGWDDIRFNILVLAGFAVAYLVASALTLRKQER